MPQPGFILLAVDNPQESAVLYEKLLGVPVAEVSPGFALFACAGGLKIGLWARTGMVPPPAAAGGSELGFPLSGKAELDALHAEWQGLGLTILQPPQQMDFGWTFTAADPDGNRLRAFVPVQA